MRTFPWYFIIVKFLLIFHFLFQFLDISHCIQPTIKFLFDTISNFFSNFIIFFQQFIIFFLKRHNLVSKSLLYALPFGKICIKVYFFSIFVLVPVQYIKPFLPILLDTKYFINIYIVDQNRVFMLVKFLFFDFIITKFCNFLIHFYIYFQRFFKLL